MKTIKQNDGFSHGAFMLLFVVMFAIIGIGRIVTSHADTLPKTTTYYYGSDKSKAYSGVQGDASHEVIVTYRPGQTNRPWVMTIHGGYWTSSSPASIDREASILSAAGFTTFNISYPLLNPPAVNYYATRSGPVYAFDWIKAHAAQFGINPNRGALYGFSAGGNLALELGLAGDGNTGIKAILTTAAVSQPIRVADDVMGKRPTTEPSTAGFVRLYNASVKAAGCPITDTSSACQARWRFISPQYEISPHDPPVLMFEGTADDIVPYQSGAAFAYWLHQQHVWAKNVDVPGLGHSTYTAFDGGARQKQALDFLTQYTK